MSNVKTLKYGLTAHIEAHPNKINIILNGEAFIVHVDDPYFFDLLMLSLAKAKLETIKIPQKNSESTWVSPGLRMCLHYETFGLRKNCRQVFFPNRIDKMHCSDGCRDTYNAKKKKIKNQQLKVSKRLCLFFVTFGERTNCQKQFIPKRSDARFCSVPCRDHYNKKLSRNKKNALKRGQLI